MPKSTAFIAARVANAEVSGWLPDHAVLVDDGRITAVTPASQLPSDVGSNYSVLDLGRRFAPAGPLRRPLPHALLGHFRTHR